MIICSASEQEMLVAENLMIMDIRVDELNPNSDHS